MAGKKVWLTWLATGEDAPEPKEAMGLLAQNGLQVSGAAWMDDLDKVAWVELVEMLRSCENSDLWVIAGRSRDFDLENTRYGLSMVAASLRSLRDPAIPLLFLGLDYRPQADGFPTLLRHAQFMSSTDPTWSAKVVAAGYTAKGQGESAFRFNVLAHPVLGQWFEVGPVNDDVADGMMFGVSEGAEITHHGVGVRGELPERCVLEYPMMGIKAEVGSTEYTACAVLNRLNSETSYYLKVSGYPARVMFGGHPDGDEAEVTVLQLK
ncbi:MAG: hypothetical protein GY703_13110 [Gammaproteobacteria bacterium]|nr:hypothetical protein [Gammaproteobacteria bacterium]